MPQYRQLDIDPMERVKRYKRFYGGLVFDALWELGIKETMLSQKIYPLRDDMILAGFALTVKIHSHAEDDETIANRGMMGWGGGPKQKIIMETVTPGCVICIDTGPNTLVAQWGEMSCHLAQNKGAVGVLCAGNVRDTRVMLGMDDFPVYVMGTTANARTGWKVNEINTNIYMPGHLKHSVKVTPGDFIFGDTDGVQTIPRDVVDEVMLICEGILDKETNQRKEIEAGMSIEAMYKKYGNL